MASSGLPSTGPAASTTTRTTDRISDVVVVVAGNNGPALPLRGQSATDAAAPTLRWFRLASSCPLRGPLVTRSGVAMTTEWRRALVQETAAAGRQCVGGRGRYFNGLVVVADSLGGARKPTWKQSFVSYPTCVTITCEVRQWSKNITEHIYLAVTVSLV